MARGLYALCRTDKYEPVRMSTQAVYPTSLQTKHPLFCHDCEQLFNQNGENWVIPLLPKLGGTFPLRERMLLQNPVYRDPEKAVFATATNTKIDALRLSHFAIGIFFKAAVHSWSRNDEKPRIDLGEDAEGLRRYLLGGSDLPEHVILALAIDSLQVNLPAFIEPYRASNPTFRNYVFYVPGMVASIFVGAGVRETMRLNDFTSNPNRPIVLEELSLEMRNIARKQVAGARRTKKLDRTTAEIEAMGLGVRLGEME